MSILQFVYCNQSRWEPNNNKITKDTIWYKSAYVFHSIYVNFKSNAIRMRAYVYVCVFRSFLNISINIIIIFCFVLFSIKIFYFIFPLIFINFHFLTIHFRFFFFDWFCWFVLWNGAMCTTHISHPNHFEYEKGIFQFQFFLIGFIGSYFNAINHK